MEDHIGTCELRTNGHKFGEMVSLALDGDFPWSIGGAFTQTDLCRSAYNLVKNSVFLPGQGVVGKIPLVKLVEVAELGPDGRDIYDGFSLTDSHTAYPAFWGYAADRVMTLAQS